MKKILFLMGFATFTMNAQVPSYVPTCGLVGYWSFSGNANDVSGNSLNGTNSGAVLTTDRFDNANSAYSFNGSNQKIIVADNDLLSYINSTFSYSYWLNIDSNTSDGSSPFCKYGITDDFEYGTFIRTNTGTIDFSALNLEGSCGVQGCSNSNLIYNNWHNFVFVSNGSNGSKLYMDGNLIDSQPYSSSCNMDNGVGNLYFGMGGGWNQQYYYKGLLDDIGVWNRVLTQVEITSLYNSNTCYQTVTDTLLITIGALNTVPQTFTSTISITPNPAHDHITIDCGNLTNVIGCHIEIINTLGQVVFNQLMNTQQYTVALNTWTGVGIYFVKIFDASNTLLNTKKIILQ